MNRIKMYALLIASFLLFNSFSGSSEPDSLITVLKSEINKEQYYTQQKESRIQKLKKQLTQNNSSGFISQFRRDSILFEEYRSFKYDSAFIYARRMIELSEVHNDKARLVQSTILLSTILLNSGMYKEAFDELEKVETFNMSPELRSAYLILRARINAGIAAYDNDAVFSKIYLKRSEEDFKNAESASPSNSFEKTINLAFNADSLKKKGLNVDFFFDFITHSHLSMRNLAMASTRISYAFKGEDRIRFLALAAINDMRSATKETLAILLLGQELFKAGNSKDAYLCIQEAVSNAKFYGGKGHQVQIQSVLPIVASKLLGEKQHERDQFLIGFLLFLIIAVLLFFVLFIYRKQMLRIKANERVISVKNKELEVLNQKLWESSRIKEEFIGLFFSSESTYIETLEKIKHKIQHHIKHENYQQASTVLNQIQIERQRASLYQTLDNMILTLFPNFISSFNLLLREEEQFWPKAGETLNTNLRIFALMRLGINELDTIAKILNYRVSTVYTYKMRIKSKAIVAAEDFERKVMEIKFTDVKTNQT